MRRALSRGTTSLEAGKRVACTPFRETVATVPLYGNRRTSLETTIETRRTQHFASVCLVSQKMASAALESAFWLYNSIAS